MVNFLPASVDLTKSLGARRWAKELKDKSMGRPVAFMNSYQRASLYEFYAGTPAFSLNNIWGRKNQYSIWDTEAEFQGKSIAMVANYPNIQHDSILFSTEYLPFSFIDNFRSTSNVSIQSDLMKSEKVKPSDTLRFAVRFNYWNGKIRDLESNRDYPSRVGYSFFQFTNTIDMRATELVLKNDMIGNNRAYSMAIVAPANPGQYDFYLSIGTGWLPFGINSEKIKVIVE